MKYDVKKEVEKLKEIYGDMSKPKEKELRQAVLDNMPKSTLCPIHKGEMKLFEGISKKGNPYRGFKCQEQCCDEVVWSDRDAVKLNGEVKDLESMLGIDRPALTPSEGLEKKQKGIEKNITRREDSILEAAIRRDAVIFANTEFQAMSLEVAMKNHENKKTTEDVLKELRQKWEDYFREIYN